jgi:hypothetical protein
VSHQCPGKGCTEQVPTSKLACRSHWFQLPKELRDRIWKAWRSGDTDKHQEAIMEAVAYYGG